MMSKIILFLSCLICISQCMTIEGEDYTMNIIAGETHMEVVDIVKDPIIMDGVDKAVDDQNRKGNNMRRFVLHSVLGGTRELHDMEIYRVQIKLVESTCRNNELNMGRQIEDCPAVKDGLSQQCDMTLTNSPWALFSQDVTVEQMECN